MPTSALTTPDGSQAGLSGAYVLKVNGQDVTRTRVDPQINFIWFHQCFVAWERDQLRKNLADQFFAVAASPDTLAAWEQNPQTNPERWQAALGLLGSARPESAAAVDRALARASGARVRLPQRGHCQSL